MASLLNCYYLSKYDFLLKSEWTLCGKAKKFFCHLKMTIFNPFSFFAAVPLRLLSEQPYLLISTQFWLF